MRRKLLLGLGCAAALSGAVLCQGVPYRQDPGWKAPAEAAGRQNPLADDANAAAGGKKLFLRNCSECHGAEGRGGRKHAPDLTLPVVQEQSDGALFWKITNGNLDRGMPSFSRMPEARRWQIILHLRDLGREAERR